MALTDPISDALTVIRNAVLTQKETADVRASQLMGRILEIFKEDGYIEDFKLLKTSAQGNYKIYFKYVGKKSGIIGLKRISKPGLRIYINKDRIPRVINGLGTAVISTSKGVITDKEARKQKVGGEVLCYIW